MTSRQLPPQLLPQTLQYNHSPLSCLQNTMILVPCLLVYYKMVLHNDWFFLNSLLKFVFATSVSYCTEGNCKVRGSLIDARAGGERSSSWCDTAKQRILDSLGHCFCPLNGFSICKCVLIFISTISL